jgi:branched-chain amino acid transport system ATP-binding protein
VAGLAVRGLAGGYGRIRVLHGLDLRVGAGEAVAVLGPNGAGKTTLLRTLSGLLPATAGSVLLDGADVTGVEPERLCRRGLVHVPEGRLVFPGLSVADNLTLGGYARRRRKDALAAGRRAVLDLFPRLAERLRQPAGTLSGGEQQMLAIGRGLMSGPSVLLLDEPTVGLAPLLIREIFAALGVLRDSGDLALLLVEQNVAAALDLADRAYLLDRGRIARSATGAELRADPALTAVYLGGTPAG